VKALITHVSERTGYTEPEVPTAPAGEAYDQEAQP
jgi:hypothetical protein